MKYANGRDVASARARAQRWAAENPEAYRTNQAAWREANREKVAAYQQVYYQRRREELKTRTQEWKAANPEQARAHRAARNAKTRGAENDVSSDIVSRLLVAQRSKCANCACKLGETGYHLDHITPISKGGKHADANLELLCPSCNLSKFNKDPLDWARQNGRLL